jgi:hypothetical protein
VCPCPLISISVMFSASLSRITSPPPQPNSMKIDCVIGKEEVPNPPLVLSLSSPPANSSGGVEINMKMATARVSVCASKHSHSYRCR